MDANLTTLLYTMLLSNCGLDPRRSYQNDYNRLNTFFDFIVIGGGSAGSVVSRRLSEVKHFNVLLIEAGGYPTAEVEIPSNMFNLIGNEKYDWMHSTEPSNTSCLGLKDGRSLWPSGKVLGGSSSINGMLYLNGLKQDFDNRIGLGIEGWNWESVQPYYKNSKTQLNPTYAKSFNKMRNVMLEAGEEAGYEVSEDHDGATGFFEPLQTIREGRRRSAATAFLTEQSSRRNLKIAVNTRALKIIFQGKRAVGVQVLFNNKISTLYASKEIIVSAGTVNTPKLLMLSGIGPEKHLKELGINTISNLMVGKNLQDHFMVHGIFVGSTPLENNTIDQCYSNVLYCVERKGPMATTDVLNILWFFNTDKLNISSNVQMHWRHFPINSSPRINTVFRKNGINQDTTEKLIEANKNYDIINFLSTLSYPDSHGEILLKSKDPLVKPLIYPNYLKEKSDVETMVATVDAIKELLSTPTMKSLNATLLEIKPPNCAHLTFGTRDYWECNFRNLGSTVYHPVGTCKMGRDNDPTAVVNNRLLVKNIKNLRVIDCSVIPKITGRNINSACIMIGEKGADMIKADWKQKIG